MKRTFTLHIILLLMLAFGGTYSDSFAKDLRPAGKAERLGYTVGDTTVVIPAFVRELPAYCFADCEGLKHVEFAEGAKCAKISDFAFTECRDLESVKLPPTVIYIGTGAFRGCTNLRSINLPGGISKIYRETFHGCRLLNGITLPAGLREIGPLAFLDCQSLELSEIPSRVTKIGNNAFGRCFAFRNITLPAGCRAVDSYAFADCDNLEEITLPAKCDMLGELIFCGCRYLKKIYCPAFVPPVIECNSFLFDPEDTKAVKNCVIYVPEGRVDAYRRSDFWNKYKIQSVTH